MDGRKHPNSSAREIFDESASHPMAAPVDVYAVRSRFTLKKGIESFHSDPSAQRFIKLAQEPTSDFQTKLPKVSEDLPVCIIGAGVAGLYTAMILQSLGIPYVLLEAGRRVGGRLFTYKGFKLAKDYDYFDVGAMRFPDTPFMKRTFDLIERLGLDGKLIDYNFQSEHTISHYPYCPEGYVPREYLNQGAQKIIDDVLKGPRELFKERSTIKEALANLKTKYDCYSTRSFMIKEGYPSSVINWCETMDKSTGSYDRAFTEMVLASVAFDWPGKENSKEIRWKCIDGGSEVLPDTMHKHLVKKAVFKTKSTAIAERKRKYAGDTVMEVAIEGEPNSIVCSAVISTIPLPRLSLMDLTECSLSYGQWSAIRELRYGGSTKIGIRFKEPWWEKLNIAGGQSATDLPIRTTVYPSYPTGAGSKSRVLIASYCWTQDAERLGSLMNGDGTAQPELINRVMEDLALMHKIDVKKLWAMYTDGDYFAWNWLHDPLTMGAFAFFGPQQFADQVFIEITKPAANGKLFFAGEATSSCHAWVAGALDSAWRAVDQFLVLNETQYPTKRSEMHKIWGSSEYWDEDGGAVSTPEEAGVAGGTENGPEKDVGVRDLSKSQALLGLYCSLHGSIPFGDAEVAAPA